MNEIPFNKSRFSLLVTVCSVQSAPFLSAGNGHVCACSSRDLLISPSRSCECAIHLLVFMLKLRCKSRDIMDANSIAVQQEQ